MKVVVTAKPHMLWESVELLYAYVNCVPPELLTQPGAYCLPADAVRQMMEVACADIPIRDPQIQYYFGKHLLSEEPERATCIARNLVYNVMSQSRETIAEDCEALRMTRNLQMQYGERITSLNEYSLTYTESSDQFVSIAHQVAKLDVSQEYRQMLLESFSGYDRMLSGLEKLVMPVAKKLRPLLMPWVEQAEPLVRAWEEYYRRPGVIEKLKKRTNCIDEEPKSLCIQLRYLDCKTGLGTLQMPERSVFFHIGVAVPVDKKETESFESWEFQALRLLGSEARMRMLRAMMDKPMSARELVQLLNLHLGVVGRDINNLYDARLLAIETVEGKRRYRTNLESLRTLARHLTQLEKFELF